MITWRDKFIAVFFPQINVELQYQKADIFLDSDKLVIARLSRTIRPIFSSFLIFCCYFTRVKAREITQQNMRNSENIGHIVLRTVRQLMHINRLCIYTEVYSCKHLPSKQTHVQSQEKQEYQQKVWSRFEVNNKRHLNDVSDVTLVPLLLTLNTFSTFFYFSAVDFEQVNVGWHVYFSFSPI